MNRSVKNRPEMIPKPNKNRDMHLPLSAILPDLTTGRTAQEVQVPPLPAMLLRGFTSKRIDELFLKMRECGAGYIPLKAVITEVNRYWTLKLLLQHLAEERAQLEAMR